MGDEKKNLEAEWEHRIPQCGTKHRIKGEPASMAALVLVY
jgi:hypothetical protein